MPDPDLGNGMGTPLLVRCQGWIMNGIMGEDEGRGLRRKYFKYNDRGTITKTSEPSYDKKAAKKLWEQSAELLKMNQDEMIL